MIDPNNPTTNYWMLSEMLLSKINDSSRDSHIEFLINNPEIAKHKQTNVLYAD